MTSWSHRILGEVGKVLYLTTPINERTAYYFLLCSSQQRARLLEAIEQKDDVELTEYGTLICSGWDEPSEEHRALLREKHQVNF